MGQFRQPTGKWNVYENHIRVPLFVRGPGVVQGERERLIPFVVGRFVQEVDLERGRILVDWDADY